jgi:Mg2+ and Co2+ transporter CorA
VAKRAGATGAAGRSRHGRAGGTARRAGATPLRGRLFDANGQDREVRVGPTVVAGLDDDQLLWIDVPADAEDGTDRLAELIQLDPSLAERLAEPADRPRVDVAADRLVAHVIAVDTRDGRERTVPLTIVAGPNVVATVHRDEVDTLHEFREHTRGDTAIGRVDAPSFVAAVLEWLVNGYFRAIELLEREADRLDEAALNPRSERDLLTDLVRVRRRITGLRRTLAPHREVVAALSRPDLTAFADTDAGPHFHALSERLERALDAVETARQLVLGSFDIHMTRTAQRTNDVMKVLTVASVMLLPGSLLAGILGMNFPVEFFDEPNLFWVALAAIVTVAVVTFAVAKLRRWI